MRRRSNADARREQGVSIPVYTSVWLSVIDGEKIVTSSVVLCTATYYETSRMPDLTVFKPKLRKEDVMPRGPAASKRRRPYSPSEWTHVRPTVQRLYIDQDLTLRDVMRRMSEEHDFHAT